MEQNDERDEAYFLLYSIQLFSVVFCSPFFLDFTDPGQGGVNMP